MHLIFHYLSKNIKKLLVVDPHYPHVEQRVFNVTVDWTEFQEDVGEETPLYIPEPLASQLTLLILRIQTTQVM